MAPINYEETDTVIIGGGPSSLILSYLLHGHIPHYKGGHRDQLLDSKLTRLPDLLHITPEVYSHFGDSLRYSHQALPINALLDTLVRPNADTEINPTSCVEWRDESSRAVPHLILIEASSTGGQWRQLSGTSSDEIGTLSYAEMLSLPGYSFADHYARQHGKPLPELMRPSRTLVASYYAAYPEAVGISSAIRTNSRVSQVSRVSNGFLIQPANIRCNHLVLATGIFTREISIPPSLFPIKKVVSSDLPLLVVGSGFSAADIIIAAPSRRRIVHVFKWDVQKRPSPLKGCHQQAYPEYAGVYRQMKLAASRYSSDTTVTPPPFKRRTSSFLNQRDWTSIYEGFPNAQIEAVHKESGNTRITIVLSDGTRIQRGVGDVEYHVGRRGSLSYLDPQLLHEVLPESTDGMTTSHSLRAKTEVSSEVVGNVFAIGSLSGDSLVRHAFGCCVDVASRIMTTHKHTNSDELGTGMLPLKMANSQSLPDSIPNGSPSTRSSPTRSTWLQDGLYNDKEESDAVNCFKQKEVLASGN